MPINTQKTGEPPSATIYGIFITVYSSTLACHFGHRLAPNQNTLYDVLKKFIGDNKVLSFISDEEGALKSNKILDYLNEKRGGQKYFYRSPTETTGKYYHTW